MKIGIIGLGLMGSSLAWQLKQSGADISAWARRQKSIDQALTEGVIHHGSTNMEQVVKDRDLILISLPIEYTPEYIQRIDDCMDHPVIVMDISSVKRYIMESVEQMDLQYVTFVGGHPMAGSEKTGQENRIDYLFRQRPFVVTYSDDEVRKRTKALINNMVDRLEAEYIEMDPIEHDQIASAISHFPYLIANSLFNRFLLEKNKLKRMASTGFESMTRIAHADPLWGLVVLLLNNDQICDEIDYCIEQLNDLKELIIQGDMDPLLNVLNVDSKKINVQQKKLVKKYISDYYTLKGLEGYPRG